MTPTLKAIARSIAPGVAAGLIATAPLTARGQDAPPPDDAPSVAPALQPQTPPSGAPSPEDLARDEALAHDRQQAELRNPAPQAKPKITGGTVAEAGGGIAGSLLAQGVGTAVAGPIGGFAAGWIGGTVGSKAVHVVRRVLGHKDQKDQPETAQQGPAPAIEPPARDAAAEAPTLEPTEAPSPD